MGLLLYDADRIPSAASGEDPAELVDAQLDMILDPFDPAVVAAAKAEGMSDDWIRCAQNSPIYKFVKVWRLALPLHPEYRTMAMMFYVPPLSPVVSTIESGLVRLDVGTDEIDFELFNNLDNARLPIRYLANLFSGGNEEPIRNILRKMLAVRILKRRQSVEGEVDEQTERILSFAGTDLDEAEDIYRLTTLPNLEERFVLPPYHREMATEAWKDPLDHKGDAGLGYIRIPIRGA